MRVVLLMFAFLVGTESIYAQNVFKCTDGSGKQIFSDRPCEANSATKAAPTARPATPSNTAVYMSLNNTAAPAELVAAYVKCQSALKIRSVDAYADCLSSRRANGVKQAKTMASSIVESTAQLTPPQPTVVDGKLTKTEGRGTLRLSGSVDGKTQYGVIDLLLEEGIWKVDQQAWSSRAFETADQARTTVKSMNDQQTSKACTDAKAEPQGYKSSMLDLLAGEILVAKLSVPGGSSLPFEYASATEQNVMFRADASARLRCKYGNDYPISICYASEPCVSSWFAGRKFPSQNGRVRGVVKNGGAEPIDVTVVIGKPF